ncbi:hypothetical protein [Pseudarthrobacter sp. NIBRBAC000502770]|uniref:hypothetical protein n=1 Tax=Pseudarthrobacter sp. NIBRBAC000502770 TaxID=2590785 RepID=UPI0011408CEC|nr:hypothetical protein [Pseudarthrobacter sp. NIBRBAC000502770]QDG88855.1 hypothetical protein NIBR502770_10495 [Pseudarthrobacter sp. NIBRBAC000502770]
MSYDVWATVEPAPNRFSTYLDLGNMTSNVAPMWRKACPSLDGLAGIDGKKGSEVSSALSIGLLEMFVRRRTLEYMAPANGWGSFAGAFRYFAAITRAANEHPDALFGVSR